MNTSTTSSGALDDKPRSRIATVLRVTSGNFMEMYDFFLFGFYATYIAKAFFPAGDEVASLMMTFMTFGAGFLMRPLGAIVLGAYVDHVGRRKGLIVTLGLMAVGTVLIACVPSYASIGMLAPVLVLIGRLLQGFSAGAELGGVSVYLAEMATPGNRGFYVSWQSGSQQVAIIFAAALGYWLNQVLSPADIGTWGWRIPFLIGCAIVPVLFVIRSSLQETEAFNARTVRPGMRAILRSMAANWKLVVAGMLMVAMTTVSFYLITVYTPTFGKTVLHVSTSDSLIVTLCVGLSNFFWLPVMGALSDRVGRKPLLLGFAALTVLTAYPAMSWLVAAPSFEKMLVVELWLSFLYASYNGAMVVALTEVMPVEVRTVGFSLAYSLATAVFGGFTPAIATGLISSTGDKGAPALWMTAAAICSLFATLYLYRQRAAHAAPAAHAGAARAA
jgi:MHS family citrate/tricarballylate:H+ symporter-like MFS transporter